MSEANVEIIRRPYKREAEAFRGGDVCAFLEEFWDDQGVLEASEEEGDFVEGGWHGFDPTGRRIARNPARHHRQP